MKIKKLLRKQLERDEGRVEHIYKDHLGYSTFGIGHLIKKTDPEFGMFVGTPVSKERVDEAFNNDIKGVLRNCVRLYPDFTEKPEEVQLIIANMMFNLGFKGLSRFKNMKRQVDRCKWKKAAREMKDSLWYYQVPTRAERLVARMKRVR